MKYIVTVIVNDGRVVTSTLYLFFPIWPWTKQDYGLRKVYATIQPSTHV